jgi:hypothetical protein
MVALKATYAFAVLGLAIASPALADAGKAPTAASSAARFNFDSLGRHGSSSNFERMRREELGRGNGYGQGPGRPGRPGKPGKPGNGHGPGHGNGPGHGGPGHGHHPCKGHDRCHASPG